MVRVAKYWLFPFRFFTHESTSIRHRAFSDLHTLAVSLTRRLVHATLFQARTRIELRPHFEHSDAVTRNDVSTALKILGVTPTSEPYWQGFARRNGVRVFTSSKPDDREPRAQP